jgi:hypothetical protein
VFNNRAKPTMFHSILTNELKQVFGQYYSDTVKSFEKYLSLRLLFDDKVSGRFKKAAKNGQPANHKSGRNDAIVSQQLIIEFEEYPPITYADVMHTFDATHTSFTDLKIVCHYNERVEWELHLITDASSTVLKSFAAGQKVTYGLKEEKKPQEFKIIKRGKK